MDDTYLIFKYLSQFHNGLYQVKVRIIVLNKETLYMHV